MYVKLFFKILDSSIWLAPDPHRLVWITLLAACDQDGNALFASAANVAARARVPLDQAREAITSFEGPDPDSGDPENEGRRIERFPGGWNVLNFHKYRDLAKAEQVREQTRLRVQKHREKKACNADVTLANVPVTTSEAHTEAKTESRASASTGSTGSTGTQHHSSVALEPSALIADGLTEQTAIEWLAHRKRKRSPLTSRAWDGIKREASKAGWPIEAAICKALERGWQSFDAGFVAKEARPLSTAGEV